MIFRARWYNRIMSGIQFDILISGQALESEGFLAFNHPVGLDLITMGFLTPCDAIWDVADEDITTTWTDCASPVSGLEICND